MIGDQDVVYIDFDDLFENPLLLSHQDQQLQAGGTQNRQQPPQFLTEEEHFFSSRDHRYQQNQPVASNRSSSAVITTNLIESLIASQSLPVLQHKKPRKKRKDQVVRYIRNPSPPAHPENAELTPRSIKRSSSSTQLQKSQSSQSLASDEEGGGEDGGEESNPDAEEDNNANSSNNKSKPVAVMTREQFYKIRPKMPRIAKSDPRRLYASYFAKAYNSCDFQQIWEFLTNYCVAEDLLFIQRWVGTEKYLNFPQYIEVRGVEKASEYWFSRCVISPDMILQLKETKLYVRSDGLSTVLSSFTIDATRLYDSEIADKIVCQSFMNSDEGDAGKTGREEDTLVVSSAESEGKAAAVEESPRVTPRSDPKTKELMKLPQSAAPSSSTTTTTMKRSASSSSITPIEPPEQISNRVFDKMKTILLAHMANEKKELLKRAAKDSEGTSYEGLRKKIEAEKLQLDKQQEKIRLMEDENQLHLQFLSSSSSEDEEEDDEENDDEDEAEGGEEDQQKKRKRSDLPPKKEKQKQKKAKVPKLRLPKDRSITFLGTLTLHLNQDLKIRQLEITFALRK